MEEIISPTEAVINGAAPSLWYEQLPWLTFDAECIKARARPSRSRAPEPPARAWRTEPSPGTWHLSESWQTSSGAAAPSSSQPATLPIWDALRPHPTGDVILLDADCHASIYDGCRLGGAEVVRFRHNDASDLEKRLRRLGERAANALILVEGIYSMLGDRAPLREIAAVKRQYGACLLVDEAHSVGVLGNRVADSLKRSAWRRAWISSSVPSARASAPSAALREQPPGARAHPLRQPALYLHRITFALDDRLHPDRPSDPPHPVRSAKTALGERQEALPTIDRAELPPRSGGKPHRRRAAVESGRGGAPLERSPGTGVYVNLVLPPATPTVGPCCGVASARAHSGADGEDL